MTQESHFFAQMARMSLIERWALMRNVYKENIAEHSLQVAMIAHMLAVIENRKFGGNVDPKEVALAAMYHDAAEVFTGDLPTPVKYQNPRIQEEYKKLEAMAEEKLVASLPEEFRDDFAPLVESSRTDENVHRIVKDADCLCALIKCRSELKAHNGEFANAAERLEESIAMRKKESPAIEYFEKVFMPSFEKNLDEISI